MKYLMIVSLLFFYSLSSASEFCPVVKNGEEDGQDSKKTILYFLPTVYASSGDSELISRNIEAVYGDYVKSGESVEFKRLPYVDNVSHSLEGLAKAVFLKMAEHGWQENPMEGMQGADEVLADRLVDYMSSGLTAQAMTELLDIAARYDSGFDPYSLSESEVRAFYNVIYSQTAEVVQDQKSISQRLYNQVEADVISGKRVILIGHGQGSLNANFVYNVIKSRNEQYAKYVGVINVGSLAAGNVENGTHITAYDDRMVARISEISSVQSGNVNNDEGLLNDSRSPSNHEFLRDYFRNHLPSRTMLDGEVKRVFDTLPYPNAIVSTGAVRATLAWDNQPDVDLHVMEPGGSHVYFLEPKGESGELDLDDTTAFGPENYYVPEDQLLVGVYVIGVNYFEGTGATTATVNLEIDSPSGSVGMSEEVALISSKGWQGNGNFVPVFHVITTLNEDGSNCDIQVVTSQGGDV